LDSGREVTKDKGKAKARKMGVPFFETSAKDSYNVEAAFRTLAAKILETESLVRLIEEKQRNPNVYLKTTDQVMTSPVSAACSQSYQYLKVGFNGTLNGIKSGWKSVTSSAGTSRSSNSQARSQGRRS